MRSSRPVARLAVVVAAVADALMLVAQLLPDQ